MLQAGAALLGRAPLQAVFISRRRRRQPLCCNRASSALSPARAPGPVRPRVAPPSLPDLPLEEADAIGELFALMCCGPPLAFEHRAANDPQPIELLLQLAVCPGRQRLVDSV